MGQTVMASKGFDVFPIVQQSCCVPIQMDLGDHLRPLVFTGDSTFNRDDFCDALPSLANSHLIIRVSGVWRMELGVEGPAQAHIVAWVAHWSCDEECEWVIR